MPRRMLQVVLISFLVLSLTLFGPASGTPSVDEYVPSVSDALPVILSERITLSLTGCFFFSDPLDVPEFEEIRFSDDQERLRAFRGLGDSEPSTDGILRFWGSFQALD